MFDNAFGPLSTRARRGTILSSMRLWALALLLVVGLVGSTNAALAQQAQPGNLVITGVNLTKNQVSGTLAGVPFTTSIVWSLVKGVNFPTGPECAVLNLELAPIHVQLLGLHVDTSAICLEITAIPTGFTGGGLLGDLLCSLAGGLVLDLPTLENLIGNAFNEALKAQQGHTRPRQGGGQSVCTGQCEILDLVLGPVDLNLLGLRVQLDNCQNGPVEICVSASRGEGILGDLLCGLTAPQISHLTLGEIAQLVQRALQLLPGGLTRQEIAELTALLGRLLRT